MFMGVGHVGRQFVAGNVAGTIPANASLDLNFMQPGVLDPRVTFTRASTATYFDATGTMQTAATNAPRWDYDPTALTLNGLLIEEARTNALRNSTFQGAVVGTPGTLPTNWTVNANATGLSFQVVSIGTENGIPCFDIRIFGTAVVAATYVIQLDTTTGIAALTAQTWCYSMYWRLTAGTLNGVTVPNLSLRETTSGGASVRDDSVVVGGPTNAALYSQRVTTGAVTLSGGATVASIQPRFFFSIANGAAVDMTLRIGAPQVEQGAFPTSYIPTTAAAVTRSADGCNIPPANMGWFGGKNTSSWFAEFIPFAPTVATGQRVVGSLGQQSAPDRTTLARSPTLALQQYDSVLPLVTANTIAVGVVSKGASTWAAGAAGICLNGGAIATSAALTGGYGTFSTTGVFFLQGSSSAAENMTGYIRRVSYWQRVLTNAELQSVTT